MKNEIRTVNINSNTAARTRELFSRIPFDIALDAAPSLVYPILQVTPRSRAFRDVVALEVPEGQHYRLVGCEKKFIPLETRDRYFDLEDGVTLGYHRNDARDMGGKYFSLSINARHPSGNRRISFNFHNIPVQDIFNFEPWWMF